jgi:Fe2+ or Zn2+ uptake regulation protein/uncharacterized coiled-coil protein SlyX
MMGKAFMTDVSISRLETVLSGIRGYLTSQLAELESELDEARRSVTQLSEQLASQQASIEVLVAGRELLVTKLAELDDAVTDSAVVGRARRSRQKASDTVPAEVVAAVTDDALVGSLEPTTPAKAAAKGAAAAVTSAPAALNAVQRDVLAFLEATPGVHKVTEIAATVSGPEVAPAALQAIRRALAVLTTAELATKSSQSGTAFYSAATPAPVPAKPRKAAAKKSATKKAAAEKPVAEKAAAKKAKRSTTTATKAKATAKTETPVAQAAEKTVRADRARIVAALQAAPEPLSAADLSRSMMGDEWRSSDATNFRNVLKSLAKQGLVAEQLGEDKRTRYAAAANA